MNKHVKVSIVIPTKNEAANIGQCLDSIFDVNYPTDEYEVIVVDNGSDDSTLQIAENKGARVFTVPEVNISALRNFGTNQANGEIIAFIDADCTVEPDWLEKAKKYFDDECVVCFGAAPVIPVVATWVQRAWFYVRKKCEKVQDVKWLESMNMFVRKDVFESVGGFNEALVTCEDVDLSYRLSAHGRIVSDQDIKTVHHGEASNISHFFKKERWRGRSNFAGLRAHGFRIDEIPSLVIPLYYIVMPILLIGSLVLGRWCFAAAILALWQAPLAGLAFRAVHRHASYKYYGKLFVLYNVYFFARGLALIT